MLQVVGSNYYKLNLEADNAIKSILRQEDTKLFEYSCCKNADDENEYNFVDVILMNCEETPVADNMYVIKQFYCLYLQPINVTEQDKVKGFLSNKTISFYVDLTHLADSICV